MQNQSSPDTALALVRAREANEAALSQVSMAGAKFADHEAAYLAGIMAFSEGFQYFMAQGYSAWSGAAIVWRTSYAERRGISDRDSDACMKAFSRALKAANEYRAANGGQYELKKPESADADAQRKAAERKAAADALKQRDLAQAKIDAEAKAKAAEAARAKLATEGATPDNIKAAAAAEKAAEKATKDVQAIAKVQGVKTPGERIRDAKKDCTEYVAQFFKGFPDAPTQGDAERAELAEKLLAYVMQPGQAATNLARLLWASENIGPVQQAMNTATLAKLEAAPVAKPKRARKAA